LQAGNEQVTNKISTDQVDILLNNVWKPCGRAQLLTRRSHMVMNLDFVIHEIQKKGVLYLKIEY